MKITDEIFTYIRDRFKHDNLLDVIKYYENMNSVFINENVFENESNKDLSKEFRNDIQTVARLTTEYYLTKVFESMKIDLKDPNVKENRLIGNIGTPGRIAKMWVGKHQDDENELMSGRWITRPRLASFPSNSKLGVVSIKEVDINSVCSHHAAIFSSEYSVNGKGVIAYISENKELGISKLQRMVDYVARRGWLQEDLTREIYKTISEALGSESVYVLLNNIVHSCEKNRGAKTHNGNFTTEYYGGVFTKKENRDNILK